MCVLEEEILPLWLGSQKFDQFGEPQGCGAEHVELTHEAMPCI